MLRVAIAGNPNSGKTSLFNAMTGLRARVGNYPGVTVERREARASLPGGGTATLVDVPGCYSLTARSGEEEVAHQVLLGRLGAGRPDVAVCVVDATCLSRGLYLAVQLLELGLPVIVALNMIDAAHTRGLHIDSAELATRLGCPVVATSARFGAGVRELLVLIEGELAKAATTAALPPLAAGATFDQYRLAPAASRLCTALCDDLAALGAPSSLGRAVYLLASSAREAEASATKAEWQVVRAARAALAQAAPGFGQHVITARFARIKALLAGVLDESKVRVDAHTERLDAVLLHPRFGLVVLGVTLLVVFQLVFAGATPVVDAIGHLVAATDALALAWVPLGLTRSLLVHGVIAGIGTVLVFVPQIALLFFLLSILEDSGYLARAAFLLDRLMRGVGLNGKAFVPLVSGFACAVPAIMAARTLESRRDRMVTMLVTPFMSCSARLPVYVLVISTVFAGTPALFGFVSIGGLAISAMYVLGFLAAIGTAFLLKRTLLRAPAPPFVLELPPYRLPVLRDVARRVLERCRVFVVSTGSIIVALSIVMWALMTFPRAATDAPGSTAQLEQSIAGRIGHAIEPVIAPLGFDWRIGIGLVASFAAREVLVSTLGQVYALGDELPADSPALHEALRSARDDMGRPHFSPLVGTSLMAFFVLALQCLSTIATMRRETNSWRWPLVQLTYMNLLAFVASLVIYQGGLRLGLGP